MMVSLSLSFFLWLWMVCLTVNMLGRYAPTRMPHVSRHGWDDVQVYVNEHASNEIWCMCDLQSWGRSRGQQEESEGLDPESHWLILPLVIMSNMFYPVILCGSYQHWNPAVIPPSVHIAVELLWRLQDDLWLLPPLATGAPVLSDLSGGFFAVFPEPALSLSFLAMVQGMSPWFLYCLSHHLSFLHSTVWMRTEWRLGCRGRGILAVSWGETQIQGNSNSDKRKSFPHIWSEQVLEESWRLIMEGQREYQEVSLGSNSHSDISVPCDLELIWFPRVSILWYCPYGRGFKW